MTSLFVSIFMFLLILAPFVSSADTLADKRGQLTVCILSFCNSFHSISFIKNLIPFSLVSASPALGGKCRARRGDRGMLAYTGQNRFYWFCSHLFLFLRVCSHLPLSSANAATFPDKRGQLTVCILSFCNSFHSISFIKNLIPFSLVSASPALGGKCRARRGDRGMLAYTGQNRFYWFCSHLFLFLRVCSHLPLSSANAATFPDKRGQLTVCILSFCNKTSRDSFFA